ncbi:DUF4097 family beta strand repeat-containing protein [Bacillus changyiensis]|uniref:DUF4097 family beta strand repeat-containing protein n=1 Tax=Bacillus changyiensis TaxID=3004103 RepID=UPI0022E0AE76|nr:DUF4097 domain-containing protein [Bacillus changyiensis]MDA1476528.1 DUF4097 domain-containing protein [Bacillus changyiensis]
MMSEKERILKLVETGKLSAKEALILLEKLDADHKQKEQKVTALSENVFDSDQFYSEKKQEAKPSIGSKLFDWIDTAVKKVKEADLDLNFGQSFDIKHIFQFKDVDFSTLDIQLANGSVNLIPWSDSDIRIECQAKVYRMDHQDEARQAFLQHIDCGIDGDKFTVRTEKKTMKTNLVIYIPEKEYSKIRFKLFNGPVRGEHLNVKELFAKTTNGVLSFAGLSADKATLETANGQIKLADLECGEIEAETINGLIDLKGTCEMIDLQSFNGNIVATVNHPHCRSAYVKTTTGSIELNVPLNCAVTAELKSNLGSLTNNLLDAEILKEKNETIQKEMYIKANQNHDHQMTVFLESKTGSIHLNHTQE